MMPTLASHIAVQAAFLSMNPLTEGVVSRHFGRLMRLSQDPRDTHIAMLYRYSASTTTTNRRVPEHPPGTQDRR